MAHHLYGILAILILISVSILLRVTAPSDLYDNAQPGTVAYIVDVGMHDQWLMQREPTGQLMTKPPLYPWIGGLFVKATGRTTEWVFKLPIVLAFLITTALVFDLARRAVDTKAGLLAAMFWAANYMCFKLMYTARPDMLVTMWVVLGLWTIERQRQDWLNKRKTGMRWITLYWLSVALGLLTKGPPGLIPVVWLAIVLLWYRPWKQLRPVAHVAAMLVALALPVTWLIMVLISYPDWVNTIQDEVTHRVFGTGSVVNRTTPMLAVPGYYLARFAPWSLITLAVIVLVIKRQGAVLRKSMWAAGCIGMIIVFFMIPKGRRADYLLPACAVGAVLAAALIAYVQQTESLVRAIVHVILLGAAIGAIGGGLSWPWWTEPLKTINLDLQPQITDAGPALARTMNITSSALCVIAGVIGAVFVHLRNYLIGALACAFAIVGGLGLNQNTLTNAAKTRTGDTIRIVADYAQQYAEKQGLPIACYEVSKTPVQALLGTNYRMDGSVFDSARDGGVIVAGEQKWKQIEDQFNGRTEILLKTDKLSRSKIALLVVHVPPHAIPQPDID